MDRETCMGENMFVRVCLVAQLWILASCAGPDEPTRPTPPGGETPTITTVDPLKPGQTGVIRGTHLRTVTRITVDGKEAEIVQAAETEIRFTVPVLRACDTDGRGVDLVANGTVRMTGRVAAPGLVALEPGESRLLSVAELSCLSFSASTAAYVLSMHNFSQERASETFFRLRSYTVAPDTIAGVLPSFSVTPVLPRGWREEHFVAVGGGSQLPLPASTPATPFDPRYATAGVGDTLVFVDWTRSEALTAASRAAVPVYHAVIVALAGAQVVLLDLRSPGAAELLTDAPVRDRLQRAAAIADRYALAAVRAVIDPELTFPTGAGGRVFTVVRQLPAGIVGGITTADLLDTSYSPWVSDIGVVDLSAGFVREPNLRAEQIASTLIHEQAHLADVVAARRRGVAGSTGWVSEAFAVSVEERATRMAVGREHQVTVAEAQANGVPAAIMRMPDALSERYSPWGPFGTGVSASSTGAYVRGARLLLHAMERMGETGFEPSGSSLYQRLLAHSSAPSSLSPADLERIWGMNAVAAAAGLSAEELMDQASMAELSDDLVDPQATAARGLPQFRTWSNALQSRSEFPSRAFPTHWLPLDQARGGEISVPGGAHHYFYFVTETTRGLSLSATQIRLQTQHRVRVTRLW
jgi:hypothetical protein